MDMGVEIEFFPLQFEEKDWQLRSPVDRFEKVWMSWRLPPLQRRKNIFVPMVSLKLPRVAIECLKLSQMFVALIVAMTRHSMVGQQSHASVFRPISTRNFPLIVFGAACFQWIQWTTWPAPRFAWSSWTLVVVVFMKHIETYTSSGLH